MNKVQLYIEGSKIDLFKDNEISLNSSIQNVRDISKVFTDFTKTFAVPASKNNNKIFKHYYDFNIASGFDARIKKTSHIELNTLPFKKGKVRLDSVQIKNGKPYSYKITFFGNIVNLKDLLGDDTFNEIASSFFSQFDQQYSATTVSSTLQSGITVGSYTDAILTPLISNTTRLYYNSNGTGEIPYSSNGVVNKLGGNLFAHSGDGTTHFHGVYYEELKYALRIHILIKAIENHYDLSFSDDFFNESNDVYHEVYMWLHKKAGRIFESNESTNLVNTFTQETDINLGCQIVSDGSTFSVTDTSTFIRNVLITVQLNSTSNAPYTIVLKKNGVVVQEQLIPLNTTNGILVFGEQIVAFNQGGNSQRPAEYQILVKNSSQITFNSGSSSFVKFTITDFFSQNETITQTNLSSNFIASNTQKFIVQENIPDIKVIDFLTSLFKMFNLTAYEEDDGTIKVQTLDSFYRDSTKEWNLTKNLETEYDVSPSLPFKEVDFGYEGLSSFVTKDHLSRFGQEWGTDKYKYNQGENENSYDALGEVYKVEPKFEHSKFERLLDYDSSLTDIQVGWFVNDSENVHIGKPLLFFPIKITNGTEIRFLNDQERVNTNSHTDLTTYYIPSNSIAISSSVSKKNINFKLEQNEYDFGGGSYSDTLFNLFYKAYISKSFNSKNRITKLSGYLPLNFMLNHTLADKIIFKDNKYFINSLKMNLNTGKSKIELLNDIKVANEIFITTSSFSAEFACSLPDSVANTRVYYDLNSNIYDFGIKLFQNESLSIPFVGNGGFYKIKDLDKTIQISSNGIVSNYSTC